jgi:hypothetical protein
LREDTPLPFATAGAGVTQELDPSDILEVQDMAAAIARAEKLVSRSSQTLLPAPAPSSGHDIFESLGRRATDDTAGPATPAPTGLLTPIPPAYATAVAPAAVAHAPVARAAAVPAPTNSTPRYVTMPSAPPTGIEEDAFYHPLGRMRSLADATLDGYRPEPTLLVRAASRRKRFSWLFVAALLPLLVLAAIAIFANGDTTAAPVASSPRAPSISATTKLPLATTSAAMKAPSVTAAPEQPAPVAPAAKAANGTPVFDVNSLPSAGSRGKR